MATGQKPSKLDGWSETGIFDDLRENLQNYVALQTKFAQALTRIEKQYKTEKSRLSAYKKALNLLVDSHNETGQVYNRIIDYIDSKTI